MKKVLLGLLISVSLWGQGQSVDFSAPPPAPPIIVSVNTTGVTGTTSYYYFVVANYPIGSAVSAPFLITNANATLSVSNFNTVFWTPTTGATTYSVVRNTVPTISFPCGSCSVASGITGTSQVDQSNALGALSPTLAASASGFIRINNRDFTGARLQSSLPFQLPQLIFPDGTSMVTANAGTPTGPAGGDLTGTFPNPTIANGAVTNVKLANSATTVNGQTCTLGAGCTVQPGGAAGGVLNGTYPNPGLANNSVANANLVNSATTVNGATCTLGSTCTISAGGNISSQAGADFGAKANACLATLVKTCNGTDITGAQTATSIIAVGANQTLLLPCATLTSSSATAAFSYNVGSQIIGCGSGGGTSNTVPTRVNLSASGANGAQAYCLTTPCATATKPDGVVIQGVMFSQANALTGIGVDYSATGQSYFADLMFNNFRDAMFNSLSCGGGAGFPSCNYNQYTGIHGNLPNGGNGMHFSKSSNAQHMFNVNFIGGLIQYLVEDPTNQTNIANEIDCFGCVIESLQTPLSAPTAPTVGDSGGGGATTANAKVSCMTAAGETLPSNESTITTLTGNTLTIAAPTCGAGTLGWRPYASTASGAEKNQVAAGTCSAITVNGLSMCPLGTGWTQTGAFSTTTAQPSTINASGAGVAVQLGISVAFYGGRCEPGNAGTVCAQTFPANTAGPLVIDGMYFQFASATSVAFQDQSGLLIPKDTGSVYKGYKTGVDSGPGVNLVPNYSFEGWNGTTLPFGWSSVSGTNFDTTGFTNQDTTNVNSGTFNAKLGDTNTLRRGIDTTNAIAIDQSKPYTMAVSWASADTTSRLIIGYRLYDSSGTLINDQSYRVIGIANIGSGGIGSTLNAAFASGCNCFETGAVTPSAINTKQQLFQLVKFPPGTAAVRIAFYTGNAAPAGSTTLWVDDVYFAQGSALQSPTASATQCAAGSTLNQPCDPMYAAPLRESGNNGVVVVNSLLATREGADLTVAANTIAPTASYHKVAAGTIKTITVPTGLPAGACITLEPTGAFTYDATGNVLGTGTATISRVMQACWNGTKWAMGY